MKVRTTPTAGAAGMSTPVVNLMTSTPSCTTALNRNENYQARPSFTINIGSASPLTPVGT